MKSVSLAKLLVTSVATVGLLVGCAGSDTKEEASTAVEQPVQQETAATDTSSTDATAMQSSTDDSNATDSSASTDMATSYEVNTGDNLWNISSKNEVYADPYQWPLIYKANRDSIKDADLIYSGQVLTIDRYASQSDVDSAVSHAKSRGAWTLGAEEASDKAYLGE